MGSKTLCIFIFILIQTIAIAIAQAAGTPRTIEVLWRFNVLTDFPASAAHHGEFQVGDELLFKYLPGKHNVIEVDKNGFENCIVPPAAKALTSGEDRIKLTTPGTKWFICGIGPHCKDHAMKIQVDVKGPSNHKDIIVGYEYGWTKNYNYQPWANEQIFNVGDKLVFNYKKGKHNVIQVDETSYKQCIVPPKHEALTSGHDEVILKAPGGVGFISGIGKDCKKGMKFFINVGDNKPKPPVSKTGRKIVS
ncbi:hypothetical protein R6Q59_032779 [Mikania micrantha]|uniref:Phytocyanin domain-containing protein n=1 Tax=Mikania micrantha TaxID=192012 RepID=A0A5N6NTK1_9ASTR|nr:hypothetical protein E3N88_17389 [Mikania micrantha]